MIGVATDDVGSQDLAVIVTLGRGAGDATLALVVVEAIAQVGVDEVVALFEAAVQGEGIATDIGGVAAVAVHAGVQEAVGHAQGQLVGQLAIGAEGDAAVVGVEAGHAVTQVLVGIAVQRLGPNTGVLQHIPRGHTAQAAGAIAGDVAHQCLPTGSGLRCTAVHFGGQLFRQLLQRHRILRGIHVGLEHRIVGIALCQPSHHLAEGCPRTLRVGRATDLADHVADFVLALGADLGHDLVVATADGVDVQQGRAAGHAHAFILQGAGLDQGIGRTLGLEVVTLGRQLDLRALGEFCRAGDRNHGLVRIRGRTQVESQRGVAGHVQVALDSGVRLTELQVGRRVACIAADIQPTGVLQADVRAIGTGVGAIEGHVAVHFDVGQVDQVAGDAAGIPHQVHAATGLGGIDGFVLGNQVTAVLDDQGIAGIRAVDVEGTDLDGGIVSLDGAGVEDLHRRAGKAHTVEAQRGCIVAAGHDAAVVLNPAEVYSIRATHVVVGGENARRFCTADLDQAVVDQFATDAAALELDTRGLVAIGEDLAARSVDQVALQHRLAGELETADTVALENTTGHLQGAFIDQVALDGGRVDQQASDASALHRDVALVLQVAEHLGGRTDGGGIVVVTRVGQVDAIEVIAGGLHLRIEHQVVVEGVASNSQPRSSFELKQVNHDYIKLKIQGKYSWSQIERFGEKRRVIASKLLQFLIGKLAPASKGKDLMVQSTFGELVGVIESDLELSQVIPPNQRHRAIEHVLLYLHKQEVLTLNHGMTVMRRAMTIEVNADKKGSYLKDDYLRLDEHYSEKRIQVHVMREYAEVALTEMANALELVLHYFTDSKDAFLQRYFAGREEVLKHATSEASWRSIVEDLSTQQRLIVVDDDDVNRLVLAGPGSGKTRVIVHRIAYLLRVRRVPANAIVALIFNRHAANEIRKRLLSLVGADAYGVSVMTYHSMAMRLTGTRFERRDVVDEGALKQVLEDAVELLEGTGTADGEDDLREQLLRGYRYILVDEYQDIDALQYRLVSALAGRQSGEEGRLCILAVGDDDQNIYAWRDTNNRYIERFREDYSAATSYLVENYRSTQRIIAAANQLVDNNPGRLKASYPIRINRERQSDPLGGQWQTLDSDRSGRVARLAIESSDRVVGNLQAQAAIAELKRLLALEVGDWNGCSILARTHHYLWPVQALCELGGIPYFLASDKDSALPITRQRDFVAVVDQLREINETLSAAMAWQQVSAGMSESWRSFFQEAFTQLQVELGECLLNSAAIVDWLYDYAREMRQQAKNGLYLGTVHSAKGLEFRHVVLLDGGWSVQSEGLNDERRLYYVGMTRAEQTLTLCEFSTANPFSGSLSVDIAQQAFTGDYSAALERRYLQLSLKDIDIGFAGRSPVTDPIHAALRCLEPGAELKLEKQGERYLVRDGQGRVVGRTSQSFKLDLEVERCEVVVVVVRFLDDSEEQYRSLQKCQRWEIIVPRLCGVPQPPL